MRAPRKPKLSKGAQAVLSSLLDGNVLHAQGATTQEEIRKGALVYWLEPAKRAVTVRRAQELISCGYIAPCEDGLFDGISQSWVPRR